MDVDWRDISFPGYQSRNTSDSIYYKNIEFTHELMMPQREGIFDLVPVPNLFAKELGILPSFFMGWEVKYDVRQGDSAIRTSDVLVAFKGLYPFRYFKNLDEAILYIEQAISEFSEKKVKID